jgi:hypothetical protein
MRHFGFLRPLAIVIAVCASAVLDASSAPFLFESATFGGAPLIDGQAGGIALLSTQFLGARFEVDDTLQVQSVGGDIVAIAGGSLFAAIIPLNSLSALPSGPLGSLDVIAETTFTAPFPGGDVSVPLSATLEPGVYGLLFGSGLFGATGEGAMPRDNKEIPGGASLFDYHMSAGVLGWYDSVAHGLRFFVKGDTISQSVPDTGSTLSLLALGVVGLVILRRRMPAVE